MALEFERRQQLHERLHAPLQRAEQQVVGELLDAVDDRVVRDVDPPLAKRAVQQRVHLQQAEEHEALHEDREALVERGEGSV